MNKNRGFTLIELAVVVAIIAILAAIAIPSYLNQTRKARRMEVKGAMQQIALVQERFRADCTTYATGFSFACPAATPPTFPALNTFYSSTYYDVTFVSANASSYKIKAAAKGTQTKDGGCTPLFYDFGVTTAGAVTKTPPDCWAK